MTRFGLQPLASGSSGNLTLVALGETYVLVDIGLSCKQTKGLLAEASVPPERIEAILITHEHSDHVRGLAVFSKHFKPLLYMTEGSARSLFSSERPETLRTFRAGDSFCISGVEIDSLKTSHDGAEPCGYRFRMGERAVSVVTDTGKATADVKKAVATSDVLLLESNHDPAMLQNGPYPYFLKKRIASTKGHLSNADAADLVGTKANRRLRHLILAHLSKENNVPELAVETMARTVAASELFCQVHCARPKGAMGWFLDDSAPPEIRSEAAQMDWTRTAGKSPKRKTNS